MRAHLRAPGQDQVRASASASSPRSSTGGGTRRPLRPSGRGAISFTPRSRNQSQTRRTSSSGAEAPEVMPTTVTPSSQRSSISVSSSIRYQATSAARATSTSRLEFGEFDEPITSSRLTWPCLWRPAQLPHPRGSEDRRDDHRRADGDQSVPSGRSHRVRRRLAPEDASDPICGSVRAARSPRHGGRPRPIWHGARRDSAANRTGIRSNADCGFKTTLEPTSP